MTSGSKVKFLNAAFQAEQASFSCRIQLLVSKFGRSSKPSPRFLILVSWCLEVTLAI